jgi:hypothetical protein
MVIHGENLTTVDREKTTTADKDEKSTTTNRKHCYTGQAPDGNTQFGATGGESTVKFLMIKLEKAPPSSTFSA